MTIEEMPEYPKVYTWVDACREVVMDSLGAVLSAVAQAPVRSRSIAFENLPDHCKDFIFSSRGLPEEMCEELLWEQVDNNVFESTLTGQTNSPQAQLFYRRVRWLITGAGFVLDRIVVVLPPKLHMVFDAFLDKHEKQRETGLAIFNKGFQGDALKRKILALLKAQFDPRADDSKSFCNTVTVFHGCSMDAAMAISRSGAADLRLTDGGFFGAGIYGSTHPKYAATYSKPRPDDPTRERCMIMGKAAVATSYPITRMTDYERPEIPNCVCKFDYRHPVEFNEVTQCYGQATQRIDKALEAGFDSHFIVVRRSMYNAVDDPKPSDYYELVLKEPAQVLPLCRIYFHE